MNTNRLFHRSVIVSLLAISLFVVSIGILAPKRLQAAPNSDSCAFINVCVIPMNSETLLEDQTVLVEKGVIVGIGPSSKLKLAANTTVIDGEGKYLIPGLADMHAHVFGAKGHMLQDYLDQGVTTVRNMQGDPVHIRWREQISEGRILGPRLYTTGPPIGGNPPLGRKHVAPKTAEEARRLVREHKETGYDFIKVYSRLSEEIYNAILETAHEIGIPVVGHVPDSIRAKKALESGISSIEHMYGYFWELEAETSDLHGEWAPQRLFHAVEIDESKLPELVKLTKNAGTWNCPTLWQKENFLPIESAREAWNDPNLRNRARDNRYALLRALHEGGARLLLGTDDEARIIHEELQLYVEAGISPYDTLRIATHDAAEYLNVEKDIGTVEVGKQADLLLLNGNPLDDIRNTSRIAGVMSRGVWMSK